MPSNVYNHNWFDGNLVCKYPLDSLSACIDDKNNALPDDIIVDAHIAYPDYLGNVCYVSAVNITKDLVSIIISVDSTSIAALCLARPIDMYKYYTVEPLVDGISGVLALGVDTTTQLGSWIFTNKDNSRLLPRCCNMYTSIGVTSITRPTDSTPLTGNVLLTAGNDVKLLLDTVKIDNKEYNAIFIGLDTDTNDKAEVLKKYITMCEKSTEMDTCGRAYVSGIYSAEPTCSTGNISIVSDNITISSLGSQGIITFQTEHKLEDLCDDTNPLETNGNDEGNDLCPFDSDMAPNICSDSGSSTEETQTDNEGFIVCSLPTATVSYINTYTDDIHILEGGAEYGSGNGVTNIAESGPLKFTTSINSFNNAYFDFIVTDSNTNQLTIVNNDNTLILVNNNNLSILGEPTSYNQQLSSINVELSQNTLKVIVNNVNTYTKSVENLASLFTITINNIRCSNINYD